MSLLLHIIVTYIKENITTKLQKLYSLPRDPRAPMLFVKKPLCTGDLSPAHKIFIERPALFKKRLFPNFDLICFLNNKLDSISVSLLQYIKVPMPAH